MKVSPILAIILALISLSLPACNMHKEEQHDEAHKIMATNPAVEGRYPHPAICLPDPLAAPHQGPCLGARVSRGDHNQGGSAGEGG